MFQEKKDPQIDITDKSDKRVFWILASVIFVSVIVLVLYAFGVFHFGSLRSPEDTPKEQVEANRMTPRTAYDIALPEAKKWQADAALSSLTSGLAGDLGRSDSWKLIFVSKKTKGKGYVIEIADKKIVSVAETPYTGAGAEFPTDLISPEEAIKQVEKTRKTPEEILGIEAIYGAQGKIWYWGVKTSKGITTIRAQSK